MPEGVMYIEFMKYNYSSNLTWHKFLDYTKIIVDVWVLFKVKHLKSILV